MKTSSMHPSEYYTIVELSRAWNWEILITDSKYQIFTFKNRNVTLYNPLFFDLEPDRLTSNYPTKIYKTENEYQLVCKFLILKFDSDFENDIQETNYSIDFLKSFVAVVRWISKQVSINSNQFINVIFPESKILERSIQTLKSDPPFLHKRYKYNLVHWNYTSKVNELLKEHFKIPIYDEILMDSLEAIYQNDCRKSITYSTIALESFVASVLDNEFNKLLDKNDPKFRIIEQNTKEGINRIDPIYKLLKERTSFSNLVHERSLYVINKSLKLDNFQLYNDALKLYRTRNKIVHLGEPQEENEKFLTIDIKGARKAYNTTVEVFKWLGFKHFLKIDGFSYTYKEKDI